MYNVDSVGGIYYINWLKAKRLDFLCSQKWKAGTFQVWLILSKCLEK